ncbi:ABC transporter ATP-binding protein [Jiangella ureilytica]|uniref:ABC transporter ATP-binding protein n=1 Tax=Jiangella ureilytica TaxID=2530374 RepID=A0A4V6PB30_9ACTN|nr:ATP-binding cassette domain-containing protein [Jiangella ureilytica]TDC50005.1 ABC transporter ATP-binding protein [Jiangella ureilytica]
MELVLADIEVVYGKRTRNHAVRGVSLRVRRGETLAVVGESGSGKTTIAKVAAGLQKATSGTVAWQATGDGGVGGGPGGSPARRQRVHMVFQHPVQSLDPSWRIRRSVKEPLRYLGMADDEAERLVRRLIAEVGLDAQILDRYPREVSGGQAQRVAVARALVADPEIVILDEPTASLDQTVRGRILTLLADLQVRTGVGYLMITHDISSVRRLATRIAVMYRGLIVESGPAAAVLEDPRHPYTQALISAVPVADPRVRWDGVVALPRHPDGTLAVTSCPVPGSCHEHGPGLHEVGPDHVAGCTKAVDPQKAATT